MAKNKKLTTIILTPKNIAMNIQFLSRGVVDLDDVSYRMDELETAYGNVKEYAEDGDDNGPDEFKRTMGYLDDAKCEALDEIDKALSQLTAARERIAVLKVDRQAFLDAGDKAFEKHAENEHICTCGHSHQKPAKVRDPMMRKKARHGGVKRAGRKMGHV